jgi:vancomycin resistance protein VanJ
MKSNAPMAKRRQSWFARVFALLCSIYIAGILGFFACRLVMNPMPPFLALVNSFTPFLFVPLILFLPLTVLLRSRYSLLGCLAISGAWGLLYGNAFLPRQAVAASLVRDRITVMTFNLGPGQPKPDELANAIAAEDADIVAVQELMPGSVISLRERLRSRYPYQILDLSRGTTGLLSRYPITKSEWFAPAGEGRPAIKATLNVNASPVYIFAVHPEPPGLSWYHSSLVPIGLNDADQENEIVDITARAKSVHPVIILGDHNLTDQTRSYARLAGSFQDTFREAGWGWGFTFPHDFKINGTIVPGPFIRLDYIFHSADLHAEWSRVNCNGGSDHCYLTAQLVTLSKP